MYLQKNVSEQSGELTKLNPSTGSITESNPGHCAKTFLSELVFLEKVVENISNEALQIRCQISIRFVHFLSGDVSVTLLRETIVFKFRTTIKELIKTWERNNIELN